MIGEIVTDRPGTSICIYWLQVFFSPRFRCTLDVHCTLGCFSKDTLKKNKMSTPPHNWGVPRKIISRRRGWSNKSRGLALALKVWQNRRRFSAFGVTYMAPEWVKMSYNHRGKCFRVIWGLSWQHLVCSSFCPSKRLRGSKITKSDVMKIFWWADQKINISSLIMVLESHFGEIWAKLETVFLRKSHFCIYPILAQNGLFLASRPQFWPKNPKS